MAILRHWMWGSHLVFSTAVPVFPACAKKSNISLVQSLRSHSEVRQGVPPVLKQDCVSSVLSSTSTWWRYCTTYLPFSSLHIRSGWEHSGSHSPVWFDVDGGEDLGAEPKNVVFLPWYFYHIPVLLLLRGYFPSVLSSLDLISSFYLSLTWPSDFPLTSGIILVVVTIL